jgi:hypothetical protein
MKYQIRKCETYTVIQASQVIELDPDKFKNLEEDPYTGDTEEDFLKYITKFISNCHYDEFCPTDLDEDVASEIEKLSQTENIEWTEYYNSTFDGEESWYEIGEKNEEYRKNGGFDSHYDTTEKNNSI